MTFRARNFVDVGPLLLACLLVCLHESVMLGDKLSLSLLHVQLLESSLDLSTSASHMSLDSSAEASSDEPTVQQQ